MLTPERISTFAPFFDLPTFGAHEDIRTMLYFSQSNVTRPPELGLAYALHAARYAQIPEEKINDPTAEGEAWSKATLLFSRAANSTQVLGDAEKIEGTLELLKHSTTSLEELKSPEGNRELIAAHLLGGRALMELSRNIEDASNTDRRELLSMAGAELSASRVCLASFAKYPVPAQDPYATMVFHWSSVHAARSSKIMRSVRFAALGTGAALVSQTEDANTINQQSKFNHLGFVIKQAGANILAPLIRK